MLDEELNIIKTFSSITKAYEYLGKPGNGHIAEACDGKRRTAYGYKWRYTNMNK